MIWNENWDSLNIVTRHSFYPIVCSCFGRCHCCLRCCFCIILYYIINIWKHRRESRGTFRTDRYWRLGLIVKCWRSPLIRSKCHWPLDIGVNSWQFGRLALGRMTLWRLELSVTDASVQIPSVFAPIVLYIWNVSCCNFFPFYIETIFENLFTLYVR